MTTLITRLLANENTAREAAAALTARDFHEDAIHVVSGSPASSREAMARAGLSDRAAEAYAGHLGGGNTLLAVRAPFGMAGEAVSVLRKFDTIDVDVEQEQHVSYATSDDYRSSIIPGNRKFLTDPSNVGTGTGFSDMVGWSLVTDRQRGKANVGTSTVTGGKMGMRLVSRRQRGKANVGTSTISGKLGLSTVKRPRGGKSIIRNPTPFSSALGLPTVIEQD